MKKISRKEAKLLGLTKCYGSVCAKHPELDGLRWVAGSCISCANANLKSNRALNQDRTAKQKKKDYLKQKAKPCYAAKKYILDKEYREKNQDKIYARQKRWSKANPDKVKAAAKRTRTKNMASIVSRTIARRLAKMNRTPAWLTEVDQERIRNEYKLAALLTKIEGVSWHVDHIIPLQGKLVSGLHVPSNLRVIRGSENCSKGNKYEVIL